MDLPQIRTGLTDQHEFVSATDSRGDTDLDNAFPIGINPVFHHAGPITHLTIIACDPIAQGQENSQIGRIQQLPRLGQRAGGGLDEMHFL